MLGAFLAFGSVFEGYLGLQGSLTPGFCGSPTIFGSILRPSKSKGVSSAAVSPLEAQRFLCYLHLPRWRGDRVPGIFPESGQVFCSFVGEV